MGVKAYKFQMGGLGVSRGMVLCTSAFRGHFARLAVISEQAFVCRLEVRNILFIWQ